MLTEQLCGGKAYTLNTQAYQALGIKLLQRPTTTGQRWDSNLTSHWSTMVP